MDRVAQFLQECGLSQYTEVMRRAGFDDMETLQEIEDSHLKALGVLPGHMIKIKKRLRGYTGQGPTPTPAPATARAPAPRAATSACPSAARSRPLGLTRTKGSSKPTLPIAQECMWQNWAMDRDPTWLRVLAVHQPESENASGVPCPKTNLSFGHPKKTGTHPNPRRWPPKRARRPGAWLGTPSTRCSGAGAWWSQRRA